MKIIGCDFHPSFQQIAMVDAETGEHLEKRLRPEEAVAFYSQLQGPVRVGMEACGNTLREHAVVRASAGAAGMRAVAGRCGQDPGHGSAQAEN